jgi:hypothetical protein
MRLISIDRSIVCKIIIRVMDTGCEINNVIRAEAINMLYVSLLRVMCFIDWKSIVFFILAVC